MFSTTMQFYVLNNLKNILPSLRAILLSDISLRKSPFCCFSVCVHVWVHMCVNLGVPACVQEWMPETISAVILWDSVTRWPAAHLVGWTGWPGSPRLFLSLSPQKWGYYKYTLVCSIFKKVLRIKVGSLTVPSSQSL